MANLVGRLQPFFEWVMKLCTVNLLWVVFNIPILYLILNLTLASSVEELQTLVLTIMILAPFTFFPATVAMFGVIRTYVMETDGKIIKMYTKLYKDNYKYSVLGGLFITFIFGVFCFYYLYFLTSVPLISYIIIALISLLILITLNFFANTVHTNSKVIQGLKAAFIVTMTKPVYSIGVLIGNACIVYIGFAYFPPLVFLLMGSVIAHITFKTYMHVFTFLHPSKA